MIHKFKIQIIYQARLYQYLFTICIYIVIAHAFKLTLHTQQVRGYVSGPVDMYE